MLHAFIAGLALIAAEAPDPASRPVRLEIAATDGGIRLQVIGRSDRPFAGSYALEVAADAAAGGNRTVQRGGFRLAPGAPVTLMTLNLGLAGSGGWSARLRVEPASGPAWEEVRGSD